jgi:hypothetical protein
MGLTLVAIILSFHPNDEQFEEKDKNDMDITPVLSELKLHLAEGSISAMLISLF